MLRSNLFVSFYSLVTTITLILATTAKTTVSLERNGVEYNNENYEELGDDEKKVDWLNHQDDHGIYSHRSLMSQANIKHTNDKSSEDEINSEELGVLNERNFVEKEWQLMFRAFDLMYDSMSSSVLAEIGKKSNFFEEIIGRLPESCRRDMEFIRESVKRHKLWALRMLDSNGKLPSGLTYGRFSSPGDYEECLKIKVNELVDKNSMRYKFNGKYCLIDFRLPLPERPKNKLLSVHDPVLNLSSTELAQRFPEISNYSAYASVFYEVGYLHALCIPSTCQVEDLTKSIGKTLEGLYVIVNNTFDCEVYLDEGTPIRKSQILSIVLLSLLFLNAIIATIAYHYRHKENSKQKIRGLSKKHDDLLATGSGTSKTLAMTILTKNKFYSDCFSIQSNFERLTKPDPKGLTFVHYTRIVAMALTVITHTAGMGTLQAITKPADASNSEQIFRDFIPQMLANAFSSIQIFFFMAGFMLVISTYPSIKREKGHLSFVEYATKRAIRLMPGIAATIAINFLWPMFVDGPMLTYFIRMIVEPCETNWWRTLGFLSNFDHVEKMCLRHSYFSASDYQLHLMAFPLLLLLYKQPMIAMAIAAILTVAGFVAQVIMILTKTVLPFMLIDYIDKEAFFNVVHYIHHPLWNHMSAFFYGFIIGYMVVKQIRINISEQTIKRLWLIMMPAGIVSIFAPYFWNHYKRPIYRWQMVLYVLFDRFILLTTCAWLSYATMVLGKKEKKSSSSSPPANKPEVSVAVESVAVESVAKDNHSNSNEQNCLAKNLSIPITEIKKASGAADSNRLEVNFIPRQRSSPNIQMLDKQEETSGPMKSFSSQANLSLSSSLNKSAHELSVKPDELIGDKSEFPGRDDNKQKSNAPVSNVNTLCLVLSRLTFQLYLFNMVVLWIDVNHSKYNWFFSYYFILTKAFAVYICSSLMAMVFFVLLESPCLTVYISWVKSRAEKRAKRAQGSAANDHNLAKGKEEKQQANERNFSQESLDTFRDGGICLGVGTTINDNTKPTTGTFTYIDLSQRDQCQSSSEPALGKSYIKTNDQTQM